MLCDLGWATGLIFLRQRIDGGDENNFSLHTTDCDTSLWATIFLSPCTLHSQSYTGCILILRTVFLSLAAVSLQAEESESVVEFLRRVPLARQCSCGCELVASHREMFGHPCWEIFVIKDTIRIAASAMSVRYTV